MRRSTRFALALFLQLGSIATAEPIPPADGAIAPYQPRAGHARPLVAIIGENAGTETTDYIIPYGVLAQSGAADVEALATEAGPLALMPALRLQPQDTIERFDRQFPEGADYVIVPAVHRPDDKVLVGWVQAQAAKGATVMSICEGARVLARAGLLDGKQATSHWYALDELQADFPKTRWRRDRRWVVDGAIVTTAGVTASIPASLALVEAIAGQERAATVAEQLGVAGWSAAHDGSAFFLDMPMIYTAATNTLAFWSHETIGLAVAPGIDEIALALRADAYSRTYRSQAVPVAATTAPIRTRRGLTLLPDVATQADLMLEVPGDGPAVGALDAVLRDIAERYDPSTARFVALQLEYPEAVRRSDAQ